MNEAIIVDNSSTVLTESDREIDAVVIAAKSDTDIVITVLDSILQPLESYVVNVNPLRGAAE